MLKYNHYLKELGIKPTDYPFGNIDYPDDPRYKENEEGFSESETWSLDFTFACYIYSHLCFFKEHCLMAHPAYMTEKQWSDILNKMIKAFKLYIQPDEKRDTKNKQKQINYGMRLFIKHFSELWW